ncbi:unnamed protein product [Arctogadus glacialis]
MTINAGFVENALTLAQPDYALFRYIAKMAAVEYEKCPSPHTSRFDRFEYTIRGLSVHLFSPDLNRNALRQASPNGGPRSGSGPSDGPIRTHDQFMGPDRTHKLGPIQPHQAVT